MEEQWSALAAVLGWASGLLGCGHGSFRPSGQDGRFVTAERTGGERDWPHDSPTIAVQVWAPDEHEAELMAYALADGREGLYADERINDVGAPSLYSYADPETGSRRWQVVLPLECNVR